MNVNVNSESELSDLRHVRSLALRALESISFIAYQITPQCTAAAEINSICNRVSNEIANFNRGRGGVWVEGPDPYHTAAEVAAGAD